MSFTTGYIGAVNRSFSPAHRSGLLQTDTRPVVHTAAPSAPQTTPKGGPHVRPAALVPANNHESPHAVPSCKSCQIDAERFSSGMVSAPRVISPPSRTAGGGFLTPFASIPF